MIKIALSGYMQSGKSTVAEYLNDTYGFDVFSFADALKQNLEMVGIDANRLYRSKDDTARKLMQVYGTAMREQNPQHWARLVMDSIDLTEECGGEAVVIDDLRFANEFDILKKAGFLMVRVVCSDDPAIVEEGDISETDLNDRLDEFDYTIDAGRGETNLLFHQVDTIMENIQ